MHQLTNEVLLETPSAMSTGAAYDMGDVRLQRSERIFLSEAREYRATGFEQVENLEQVIIRNETTVTGRLNKWRILAPNMFVLYECQRSA